MVLHWQQACTVGNDDMIKLFVMFPRRLQKAECLIACCVPSLRCPSEGAGWMLLKIVLRRHLRTTAAASQCG